MNKIINAKEKIFSTLEEKLNSIIEKTERPNTSEQWMTSKEVEQYLGISKTTLRSYRLKGLIPSYKLNRKLLFLRFEVNKALLDSIASKNKSK
jgi:CRISPR/Cas system endoribonuclease Cas6 (RAMP superfamily)